MIPKYSKHRYQHQKKIDKDKELKRIKQRSDSNAQPKEERRRETAVASPDCWKLNQTLNPLPYSGFP